MMRKEKVYCEECSLQIEYKEDLVVSTFFFFVVPYHDSCYSKSLKGCQTAFVSNVPINGFSGTIKAICALIGSLILFLLNDDTLRFFAIILLIFSGLRVFSWFSFERHLE